MYKRILNLLTLLLLVGQGALAQITECKGIVRSADNKEPIAGALVVISGTTHGAITDIDGRFYIRNIPAKGSPKLTISYLGYKTTEVRIEPYREIELPVENQMVGEIVVVAYGKSSKGALTGAVAQIQSEQIVSRPVSDALSALEGNVAGVMMYNGSGLPSSGPTILIRGYGSVNGTNAPIYVVDGMINDINMIADINPADIESISVLKDAASCALYGNKASNGVILINTKKGKTQKISLNLSMNQGIYVRGINSYQTTDANQYMESAWKWLRNGLMSDKTPLDEKAANTAASSTLISDYLLTNIYNKANDKLFDESGRLVADAQILDGYKDDLDWRDALERTGYRQEYSLNGGAARERGNYFFSAGYLNEKGYLTTTDFERYTARFSANLTPVQWLKAGVSLGASHQKKHYADSETTGDSNPSRVSLFMLPIYPIHQHNGDGSYTLDTNGNHIYDNGTGTRARWSGTNLIQENELNTYEIDRNTLDLRGYATVKFLKDFSFTIKGNMNWADYTTTRTYNPVIGRYASVTGALMQTGYGYNESTVMEQLSWMRRFDKHHVEILLDHENYSWKRDYDYLFKQDASMSESTNISNYLTTVKSIGYKDTYKTESYLGSVKYSYDMKYNAEFSFRRDGSSRFTPGNRWGNFWSVGANWIVTNERLFSDWQWLDLLKVRASYGEVGNDASAGLYAYKELYYADPDADVPSYYLFQNAASDLKWETSKSFNIGMDFRFFNRWNLSLDYYDKRNGDLIFNVLQPSSFGGDVTVAKNIGTISNSGFELVTDVDAYRSKDWTVNLGLNLTVQKNKVTKLPDENKEGLDVRMNNSVIYRITEGKSRYEFFLPTYVGVDRMDGQSLYVMDLDTYKIVGADGSVIGNPDGTTVAAVNSSTKHTNYKLINGEYYTTDITYAKSEYHGSALPKFFGSFNPTIKYKSLTLSGIFTFSLGAKVYDHTYKELMTAGTAYTNFHKDILKSWNTVPKGMSEDAPDRIDANGTPQINKTNGDYNNAVSSRWLVSGDYLCLKNISLSYRLPDTWVKPLNLNEVSIGGTVENLLTVTARKGLNPQLEYSGVVGYNTSTLTIPRIFSLRVNIKL